MKNSTHIASFKITRRHLFVNASVYRLIRKARFFATSRSTELSKLTLQEIFHGESPISLSITALHRQEENCERQYL